MRLVLLLAGLAFASSASAGNPWEELMGRKPKLFSDPDGRFTIDLPNGWTAQYKSGDAIGHFVKRDQDRGAVGHVTVEVRQVPPDVRAAHFAAAIEAETKSGTRGFRKLGSDRLEVGGAPARRSFLSYQERGNAELTTEVVQVTVVAGERAFVISLVHGAGWRPLYWEDFELMLKGLNFGGAPVGQEPTRADPKRPLRAGEMVNPDAIKY